MPGRCIFKNQAVLYGCDQVFSVLHSNTELQEAPGYITIPYELVVGSKPEMRLLKTRSLDSRLCRKGKLLIVTSFPNIRLLRTKTKQMTKSAYFNVIKCAQHEQNGKISGYDENKMP